MKFGEILKKEREHQNLSVKKLSDLSDVSTAYISKIENGKRKFPTEKYLFNIMIGFKNNLISMTSHYKNTDDVAKAVTHELKEMLLKFISAQDSNYSQNDLDVLYEKFENYYTEELQKKVQDNSLIENDIFSNKIALIKNSSKAEVINSPNYDLKWLLTQSEYEVFYGRSHIFKTNIESKHALNEEDMYYYNVLDNHDLKTIKKLIDVYLDSKYRKFNKSEELFNILTNPKNAIEFDKSDFIELLLKTENTLYFDEED